MADVLNERVILPLPPNTTQNIANGWSAPWIGVATSPDSGNSSLLPTSQNATGTTQSVISTISTPELQNLTSASWTSTAVENIQAVTFMRQREVSFTATGCKPNTRLYPFFSGERVDQFVQPTGGSLGGEILTDSLGNVSGTFFLPGNRFKAGSHIFTLSQNTSFIVSGNVTGDASAVYQSFGFSQAVRTTRTNLSLRINTNENLIDNVVTLSPPPAQTIIDQIGPVQLSGTPTNTTPTTSAWTGEASVNRPVSGNDEISRAVNTASYNPYYDPLAQSFHTYGLKDGIFVSSIEVYFSSKSSTEPVILEIRRMGSNGFPGRELVSPLSSATKAAADVNVSATAATSTKFTFPCPVYLEPNSDFCFVVRSNSIDYNLHVSELGGISNETGAMITEQPYVGTLFKSENNFTWTPEQYKDIKFKINRAKFVNGTTTVLRNAITPNEVYLNCQNLYTTSGSRTIIANTHPRKHGLDASSKVYVKTAGNTGSTFNGFTNTDMTGEFAVTEIINPYKFKYLLTTGTCNATGVVKTGKTVTEIAVVKGGTGYTTPPNIIITGGGATTVAVATAVIRDGAIVRVNVTSGGSGYTSEPSITVTGGGGSGAELAATVTELLLMSTNSVANVMSPVFGKFIPPGTTVATSVDLTGAGYTTLATGKTVNRAGATNLKSNAIMANRYNEVARMGNNTSTMLTHRLYSSSDYVSPVISYKEASVITSAFNINWQDYETVTTSTTSGTASVTSFTIENGGSNYTSDPTITVSGPGYGGTTAVAGTIVRVGNAIQSVAVGTPGSGYTFPPTVTISGGGGSGAIIKANLSAYNSELTPNRGNALSKYVSNKTRLQAPSTGAIVYVDAYSHGRSSFELYIRTTLSSDVLVHEDQNWRMMSCDIDRNKSTVENQILEYKFTVDDLPEFDTVDFKIVLRSLDTFDPPVISNYRAIIIA